MIYRIDRNLPVGEAVRLVAAEQTTKALDEIGNRELAPEYRIHQLRKRCKKTRALVRLVRPGFDDYHAANARYRDIARLVSDHRDARVMANLVRTLAKHDGKPRKNPVVRWYEARADVAEQVSEPVLVWAEHLLADTAIEIESWALDGLDVDHAMSGFAKALGIVHKRSDSIGHRSTDETSHEWRKACKDHWYQLRLLRDLLPKTERRRVVNFDDLGELIGDAHDRGVLLKQLEDLPPFLKNNVVNRRSLLTNTIK